MDKKDTTLETLSSTPVTKKSLAGADSCRGTIALLGKIISSVTPSTTAYKNHTKHKNKNTGRQPRTMCN